MKKGKSDKAATLAPTAILMEPLPAPPLARQSRYSREPWKPGETPANPLMRLSRAHDLPATPYGQGTLGVEKPVRRGRDPYAGTVKIPYGDKVEKA